MPTKGVSKKKRLLVERAHRNSGKREQAERKLYGTHPNGVAKLGKAKKGVEVNSVNHIRTLEQLQAKRDIRARKNKADGNNDYINRRKQENLK